MKKAILVTTCVIALSAFTTAGAFAQSATGPAGQQDNTSMSKDNMDKGGMKKDSMGTTGMKKDSMNKDGMKKDSMSSSDSMKKDSMSK
jgi:pentapeptide MXKDX repeat protein